MSGISPVNPAGGVSGISGLGRYNYYNYNLYQNKATVGDGMESGGVTRNPGESTVKTAGKKSSPAECETCSNRKYQDGSDEMVSFKSATHISPQSAASAVRSHEQEHVSNAYKKAAQKNGKVVSANVAIHTAVCPECGRSYVSGGTTTTQIKYYNEDNPYQKNLKAADSLKYTGMNLDMAV